MIREKQWYTIINGFFIEQRNNTYIATAYSNPTFEDTNLNKLRAKIKKYCNK